MIILKGKRRKNDEIYIGERERERDTHVNPNDRGVLQKALIVFAILLLIVDLGHNCSRPQHTR